MMSMGNLSFSVLVVDDEQPARDELKYLISQETGFQVVGEAGNGLDALQLVDDLKPDVVFLDIEMNDLNGIEVAKKIYNGERRPALVFATAYDQHAVKAFEVRAIDYILKPFDNERVKETLDRLKEVLSRDDSAGELIEKMAFMLTRVLGQEETGYYGKCSVTRVPVEQNGRLLLLEPREILFVATGAEKQLDIHTGTGVYRTRMPLNTLEEKLVNSPGNFFRVHRSFLVNLDQVKELVPWFKGKYLVVMSDRDKTEIPVSRLCSKELKERLGLG